MPNDDLHRTLEHPHRNFLMQRIEKCAPFGSVLEIGCNSGPNLILIAKKFPDVMCHGIDINTQSIESGKKWLIAEGLSSVSLTVGRADKLDHFPDKNFDITFSDATLIYVGPDKIEQVLREMMRVTGKAVFLNEWNINNDAGTEESIWYDLHWVHDYRSLLKQFLPDVRICVTKIPKEIWGGSGWEEYGSLIEVDLR